MRSRFLLQALPAAALLLLLLAVPAAQADGDGSGGDGGAIHVPLMLVLGPVVPGPAHVNVWLTGTTGGIAVCWSFNGGPPPGSVRVDYTGDGIVASVPSAGPNGWLPDYWLGPGEPPVVVDGFGTGTQQAGADRSC
jgi:hypothetical protein